MEHILKLSGPSQSFLKTMIKSVLAESRVMLEEFKPLAAKYQTRRSLVKSTMEEIVKDSSNTHAVFDKQCVDLHTALKEQHEKSYSRFFTNFKLTVRELVSGKYEDHSAPWLEFCDARYYASKEIVGNKYGLCLTNFIQVVANPHLLSAGIAAENFTVGSCNEKEKCGVIGNVTYYSLESSRLESTLMKRPNRVTLIISDDLASIDNVWDRFRDLETAISSLSHLEFELGNSVSIYIDAASNACEVVDHLEAMMGRAADKIKEIKGAL